MFIFYFLTFFLIYTNNINAKDTMPILIESYYGIGHNVKERLEVKDNAAQMAEIGFSKLADGTKPWHHALRMPEVGGMIAFVVPSFKEATGYGVGIGGNTKFWLWRTNIVDGYLRLGAGLGILGKTYSDDPRNRVLSTHFNVFGQIRIGADWRISPHWQITTTANYNHMSNAGIKYPNLGVDMFLGTIGVRYSAINLSSYPKKRTKQIFDENRHEYTLKYSVGLRETYKWSGKKYAVQMIGVGYAFYIHQANKLTINVQMEYDNHIQNNLEDSQKPIKVPLFLSDEILIGKIGATFGVGTYLYYANKVPKANMFMIKLGANYYYKTIALKNNHKMQLYTGAYIKAHAWNANLLEMSMGVNFR